MKYNGEEYMKYVSEAEYERLIDAVGSALAVLIKVANRNNIDPYDFCRDYFAMLIPTLKAKQMVEQCFSKGDDESYEHTTQP